MLVPSIRPQGRHAWMIKEEDCGPRSRPHQHAEVQTRID